MIQHYELLYILPGNKTDEEIPPITNQIAELIKRIGATLTKEDAWGKRKLAYEIDHLRQGFYHLVEFDVETTAVAALEKDLRLHEHVIRYTIVRKHVKTPEEIAAEEALQARIAARHQAAKEKEAVADLVSETPVTQVPSVPTEQLSSEQLDEKLEEILESDSLKV